MAQILYLYGFEPFFFANFADFYWLKLQKVAIVAMIVTVLHTNPKARKTILQQSAENGNDISRPTAEDELCARMLGELLQQEGVLEQLAAADLDMVTALRKTIAAVQEHVVQRTLQHTDVAEYADIVDNIATDPNYKTQDEFVKICEETPKILVDKANAPQHGMIIKFNKLYGLIRKDGNDPSLHYHDLGPDFAKNIFSLLEDPEKILLMANGRLNVVIKYTNAKGNNVIFSVELDVEKQIAGHFDKYNLIVTGYGANDSHTKNNENKPGTTVLYDKKVAHRKLSTERQMSRRLLTMYHLIIVYPIRPKMSTMILIFHFLMAEVQKLRISLIA